MKRQGLDALLVSDDINVRYLTGYIPPTKNRVGAVLLTKEGTVALLADAFGATVGHFTTWEREGIRVYDTPFTYTALKAAFTDLGLQNASVGVSVIKALYSTEGSMGLPIEVFAASFGVVTEFCGGEQLAASRPVVPSEAVAWKNRRREKRWVTLAFMS